MHVTEHCLIVNKLTEYRLCVLCQRPLTTFTRLKYSLHKLLDGNSVDRS